MKKRVVTGAALLLALTMLAAAAFSVDAFAAGASTIKELETQIKKAEKEKAAKMAATTQNDMPAKKKKLTYKEQKELEQIEKDLETLAAEKAELEAALSAGNLPFDQLQEASERIGQIMDETDEKEMRWLELTDGL